VPTLLEEGLIPLAEARLLIPARGGSHPDVETLAAHIKAGRLDGALVGGRWLTTKAALGRFVEAGRPKGKERSKASAEKAAKKASAEFRRRCGKAAK
jgi:hypothetical protein